jgi:hypothetical protein
LLERITFAHLRLRAAAGHALAVAEQLARWPQAGTVRLTDGSYDVYALLLGLDHGRLVAGAHELLQPLPVQELSLNTVLETVDVGRAARLDSPSRGQITELRSSRASKHAPAQLACLTHEDFPLIRELVQDGRMEIAELAGRLGASRAWSRAESPGCSVTACWTSSRSCPTASRRFRCARCCGASSRPQSSMR